MKKNFTFLVIPSGLRITFGSFIMAVLFSSFSAFSQTTKSYTAAENGVFLTDLAAGTYDIYELSTSGGAYVFTAAVAPSKSLTIRAKSGLAKMPVLSYNNATPPSNSKGFINPALPDLKLQFDGIEMNGLNAGATGDKTQQIFIKTETSATNCQIIIRNSYLHDFKNIEGTNVNGILRIEGVGSSVEIEKTTVDNSMGRLILLQSVSATPYTLYGDMKLKDCTFSNINHDANGGGVIFFRSASSGSQLAIGKSLTVDHCTFYKNTVPSGSNEVFQLRSMSGQISITNCIFDQVTNGFSFVNPNTSAPAPIISHCYLAGFSIPPTGTNTISTPLPGYINAGALNFGLTNVTGFAGSDTKTIGDTRYYTPTTLITARNKSEFEFDVYPNPATDHLNFTYNLAKSENVSLVIYNTAGQIVKKMMEGRNQVAGHYSVSFKVSDIESGIYLARFAAGNDSETIRFAIK